MSDSISQRDGIGQGTIKAGRYPWIVLALVVSGQMAGALAMQGLPVLYPFIKNELVLSSAQVGLLTSSLHIGAFATVLLAGLLTDILGVKRMAVIALVSLAVCMGLFPLIYSFPIILILVAFIGVALSPVHPATARAIIDWLPSRIIGLSMGLKQTGVPIAGIIVASILPTLALTLGWRMSAAMLGVLILAVAIAFLLLYRDAPRGSEAVPKFNFAILQTLVRNRGLLVTMLWGATFVGFQFIVLSYLILFLIEVLGKSPIIAGGLLAVAYASNSIARVSWGAVSDFIFHGRRIVVLIIVGFLTAAVLFGISLVDTGVTQATLVLLAILIGISVISFQGVFYALIGETADKGQIGIVVGIAATICRVSTVTMTPLFGYLVDMTGSYRVGWRVTALLAFLATLVLLFFGREPQRR
ncbi:MFS transporter [Chloroflexota bacterium]